MITLQQAIDKINEANPFFGSFLKSNEKVYDHCQKLTTHKFDPVHVQRQQSYIRLITDKVNRLFPDEKVKINFDEGMILDTTAHHNILNFPTIIGAHLLSRFDSILKRKEMDDYYVLDCGNVTFSEVLHKRGVEFGGKHINLYPKKDKNKLVSRYPLYQFDLIAWMKKSEHKFTKEESEFVQHLQTMIDNIDLTTCKRFSDQITKINYYLWLEFFPEEIRDNVRRCVALEHDEILIKHLARFFLEEKDNFIWRAIFDKDFRKIVLEKFDGIYGAWNYSGENTGTYFFWGFCPEDGKEHRLELKGNKLVEPNGLIREVELVPEDVVTALTEGILVPAIFTKFSMVASYMGARVMGGPGQTEYTGKLHQTWAEILEKEDPEEYKLIKKGSVLNMNC